MPHQGSDQSWSNFFKTETLKWRHDIEYIDTKMNITQHDGPQHGVAQQFV
jgi:hypothetical protein